MRKLLVILIMGFVFAWMVRVLVPYYRLQSDRIVKQQTRIETEALMNAIYKFSEESSENRFPTNLAELRPMLVSLPLPAVGLTNLDSVLNKFFYLQPTTNDMNTKVFGEKIVLVEKLGHYKYQHGGFIGAVGNMTTFFYFDDYKRIVEKNGLSMSQVGEN